jgi:hypothetical protein
MPEIQQFAMEYLDFFYQSVIYFIYTTRQKELRMRKETSTELIAKHVSQRHSRENVRTHLFA